MEHRLLGRSGLKVPVLSLGTATFGGTTEYFGHWGDVDVLRATRMVDICLDAGVNFFDTADIYSRGDAESVLGGAIKGRRDKVLLATKTSFTMGTGPNDKGSARYRIIRSVEESLKRLGTDHIDLFFMHGFDALTPVEEVLRALDDLIGSGKICYIGASNFSGWHLMKSLAHSEKYGLGRYVVHQGCYSLVSRDYEWELMPLGIDQGVGLMVWSPLGWGRLTGGFRRGQPMPPGRIASGGDKDSPPIENELLYRIVDVLDAIARETGKTIPQVALNWLLSRPTVCNIVIGARNEAQLKDNLGAVGWTLDADQIARLDDVSQRTPPYPYWHQMGYADRNPPPTRW
ncbi:aldo/keto reductase [Sphingomonas sp.]|jgi:aryl-alcohol dehydrogenase-like predicted oxidoreductase|uniref:aldo/keto reductase n=1 Tax=Sphingomonas sp. TaxID=28214 RepID=UPI002ED83A01